MQNWHAYRTAALSTGIQGHGPVHVQIVIASILPITGTHRYPSLYLTTFISIFTVLGGITRFLVIPKPNLDICPSFFFLLYRQDLVHTILLHGPSIDGNQGADPDSHQAFYRTVVLKSRQTFCYTHGPPKDWQNK